MNDHFLALSLIAACWIIGLIVNHQYLAWRQRTLNGVELGDPFFAEVFLDGVPVASLTDRKVTEMFWRDYRLNLLPGVEAEKITSEELWTIPCKCTFRDPITGHFCKDAWTCRGPRIENDVRIISLRNLYFKPEKN